MSEMPGQMSPGEDLIQSLRDNVSELGRIATIMDVWCRSIVENPALPEDDYELWYRRTFILDHICMLIVNLTLDLEPERLPEGYDGAKLKAKAETLLEHLLARARGATT